MIEITPDTFECLYVMKQLYDHPQGEKMFEQHRNSFVDGDCFYEISLEAAMGIFKDTRDYYNAEDEISTLVFMDPIITEFCELCEQYEAQRGIAAEDNVFRQEFRGAVDVAMRFDSYDYAYEFYDRQSGHGRNRLVFLSGCEFADHYALSEALLNIYDALKLQIQSLRRELGMTPDTAATGIQEKDEISQRRAA